jgi:AraC-like DNA-binding protein
MAFISSAAGGSYIDFHLILSGNVTPPITGGDIMYYKALKSGTVSKVRGIIFRQGEGEVAYEAGTPNLWTTKFLDLKEYCSWTLQATRTEPIDLDTLCSRIGTSRRTLERLAAQTVGMSPSEYYLRLRLMAGKEMLMYSNKAVSRIAEALGFSSPSDFSRAFKRAFDVSPFAFRVAS